MKTEIASLSLIGHRDENQDRVGVSKKDNVVFAAVIDGMGGHSAGARAAEISKQVMFEHFEQTPRPVYHPREFLNECVEKAHRAVVALGEGLPLEARPRATLAIALLQKDKAYWAHVGDSRIYHLRDRAVLSRTRDHSHIEILLREGLISEDEYREHPLRNYVEHCIGGEPGQPHTTIAGAKTLQRKDVLLLCSDGVWGGTDDPVIAECFHGGFAEMDLLSNVRVLLESSIEAESPCADNTSAVVVQWVSE